MDGATVLVAALGVLVGLVVVAALAGRWRRSDSAPRKRRGDGPPGDPRRIGVGDIVEIGDESYPVRGSIRLVEGEWRWAEHLFDDPGGRRRLSVAEDPEFELVLWHPEPGVVGPPGCPGRRVRRPAIQLARVRSGTVHRHRCHRARSERHHALPRLPGTGRCPAHLRGVRRGGLDGGAG